MHIFQQQLIIDHADQQHGKDSRRDPVDLFNVHAGKLGVVSSAVYLEHT